MISQQRNDWMRFLILMLPILCFLCYIPVASKNIIFIIPGIMVIHMPLGVYSSALICGGRRQRFWAALTLAVTTGILVTITVMLLAIATHPLESVMPQLTVKGHELTFIAINIKFSLVPFLMIPATLTICLIFHKKPMLKILLVIILFQILFVICIFEKNVLMRIGLMHIIIMLLCSWAIFVAVLRYISMRCCLTGQGR